MRENTCVVIRWNYVMTPDHSVVFFFPPLLHQPWSTLSFVACSSSFLPVGVSVAPSSDPLRSPEKGLAFKVVWEGCGCRKSPQRSRNRLFRHLLTSQLRIGLSAHVSCVDFLGVFGAFFWVCAPSACPPLRPLCRWLCAPCGGCHRESSLRLLAPAGPGGECLGASQSATSRVLVVLGISLISSGPGAACGVCTLTWTHCLCGNKKQTFCLNRNFVASSSWFGT